MKILIYSDVHWNTYSSIIRQRGEKYSMYLEGLIKSMNWALDLAKNNNCSMTICAGDFMNRADATSEELTALKEINWPKFNCTNYFLCGNHETEKHDHQYSSAKLFDLIDNAIVVDQPQLLQLMENIEIAFLPYIAENDRKNINDYFVPKQTGSKRLLISHNDIAGINYGGFLSKSGFSIDELQSIADLTINGHLHNGEKIADKVINIGSLSAINFSNDSSKYVYGAMIFDTDTFTVDLYENPYAFNFYKLEAIDKKVDLTKLKNNSVITLKCIESDANYYKEEILNNKNIIESRLIIDYKVNSTNDETQIQDLSVDHIEEFKKFILSTVGDTNIIKEELVAIGGIT